MKKPNVVWWCRAMDECNWIDELCNNPLNTSCGAKQGICAVDKKPCDVFKGTITWDLPKK